LQRPGQAARTAGPTRTSWARLRKRLIEIDMEHCPNCDGQLKIIAAILDEAVAPRSRT
jgi:hypothetical protein